MLPGAMQVKKGGEYVRQPYPAAGTRYTLTLSCATKSAALHEQLVTSNDLRSAAPRQDVSVGEELRTQQKTHRMRQ